MHTHATDEGSAARALERVEVATRQVRDAEDHLEGVRADWEQQVRRAVKLCGASQSEVARVAGVSRQRVSQLVRGAGTVSPRVDAQKQEPALWCVNDPATVPAIPATPNGVTSGVVSLRERKPYGRETVFVDTRRHPTVADVLEVARTRGAGRVYLTGPTPLDPSTGATQAEQVRAWVMADLPAGWAHGAHYLADPTLPVARYAHEGAGKVTVMRAAMWWGETDADTDTCVEAWRGLETMLDSVAAFRGAGLADTPATTGRALWLRTVPEGKGLEVMAPELRQLVAETSGQGRIELRPATGRVSMPALAGGSVSTPGGQDFTYLDGRFMYAALTWGMPVGPPALWSAAGVAGLADADAERLFRGRGRWRVTVTVPDTWSHVGLLMAPAGDGGWCYPDQPGQRFTTWADGSEVWLAICNGWGLDVHEGMSWREAKPLNTWTDHLVTLWKRASAAAAGGREAPALAAAAVRSILLHALGAFAARTHPVTRTAPAADNPEVPEGTEVRLVGDQLVWQEPGTLSAWSERTAHPEWSATVWARARVRLAEAALRLDPGRVVAFATDALYVAGGPEPFGPDTGKPGEFRVKGLRPGPFTWPATRSDLYLLRDESETTR